jgi:hypothetical protein
LHGHFWISNRFPRSDWSDSLAQLTGIAAGTIMARPGEKRMTKITTLCLLVGIVLFFTGHQRTVASHVWRLATLTIVGRCRSEQK